MELLDGDCEYVCTLNERNAQKTISKRRGERYPT